MGGLEKGKEYLELKELRAQSDRNSRSKATLCEGPHGVVRYCFHLLSTVVNGDNLLRRTAFRHA